jgi:hypothetical protein
MTNRLYEHEAMTSPTDAACLARTVPSSDRDGLGERAYDNRPRRKRLLVWLVGAMAASSISACFGPARLELRPDGVVRPAVVPQDEVWETYLVSYGSNYAPYPPQEAVASCAPAHRCQAFVFPEDERSLMRLSVIALSPGPASVALR